MNAPIHLNLDNLQSLSRAAEQRNVSFLRVVIFIFTAALGIGTIVALNHFGLNYSTAM